jgi:nucleoid-associated protein EbfC
MAGMNKLLKEAQKMQQKMASVQEDLVKEILDVTYGGGAIQIKINGHGTIQSVAIDPEFLKEGAEVVNAALLEVIQEAQAKVSELSSDRMNAASGGLMGNLGSSFPGLF